MPSDLAESQGLPLVGRVALVTGGTRGLGIEICRQLGALGADVVIGSRDRAKADALAGRLQEEGFRASGLRLDVADAGDRDAAYAELNEKHGVLDVLVNNAAVWLDSADAVTPPDHPPSGTSAEILRGTFEVNFFAPIFLTQALLPLIRKSSAGRIVNVSSIRGSLAHQSDPESPVSRIRALGYDSSKAALNSYTIQLADELRGSAVKVNAVHPGWVRTEMGGLGADLSLEEGARATIRFATLGEAGPSGGFFYLDERLPW